MSSADAPVVAVLQARMSSTRLPGKVMASLLGQPMLARQIERIQRSRRIDHLIVATSDMTDDDRVAELCTDLGVLCYRGALDDVLDRFYHATLPYERPHVVRMTADCPLTDPAVIDQAIERYGAGGFDCVTNALQPTFPDGLDVEVFAFRCLEDAWREATSAYDREHVTPFVYQHPERYRIGHYTNDRDLSHLRWTVDRPDDLEMVQAVYESLYPRKHDFSTDDVLRFIEERPEFATLNTGRD